MSVTTNASELAQRFRARIAALRGELRSGLRKWAAEVDAEQVRLIRGGDAPGDYPVPVRRGGLLQGHFFDVAGNTTAVVGNRSDHAVSVHEGRGPNTVHGRRPFLDDAAAAVDGQAIISAALRRALDTAP